MTNGQVERMHKSTIIEVDGIFIGAALQLPEDEGWRFISADIRTSDANGATAPTLAETKTLARRAFATSRLRPSPQA